ncbi:hypothetical protein WJX73_003852 [Symbiochloris irregularis]|uniref:Thioredoxin domain-containing protein n=1 Tax=Symbiochloris irregularis TaxID=706552 RepID=A0AAW1P418_9CHLO
MVAVRTGFQDAVTEDDFEQTLRSAPSVAIHFWAPWCLPCKQMDVVFAELAKQYPGVAFVRVEAEELSDISQRYNVTMVPHFVLLQNTKKGSPDAPRCGFSAKVVAALKAAGIQFSSFDILTDEAIRQGLKEYSNWPTYPQLYANAELLGGCDIVLEMAQSNELKQAVDEALGDAAGASLLPNAGALPQQDPATALESRLKQLTTSHPVMLFMKGTPDAPRCGFSSKVVGALRKTGIPFGTFDILEDEAVRQGLKKFSDWPTYPQLYAGGELVTSSAASVKELGAAFSYVFTFRSEI